MSLYEVSLINREGFRRGGMLVDTLHVEAETRAEAVRAAVDECGWPRRDTLVRKIRL